MPPTLPRPPAQILDVGSVDHWLEQAEGPDTKQLRTTNHALWQDLRGRAEEQARAHARIMAIWQS
jgi:hypothetical protein